MSYISPPSSKNSGFSLVELVVTIGILAVILSVVLSNQSKYISSISLNNDADEIALSLFQAQAYGLGVREVSPGSGMFDSPYGLSTSILPGPEGSNSSYIFFVSSDGDYMYGGEPTCSTNPDNVECIEKINLDGSNYISSICLIYMYSSYCTNIGRVDITFLRPNTEAIMVFYNMWGGTFTGSPSVKGVRINLSNEEGAMRSVVVYTTGQISVE